MTKQETRTMAKTLTLLCAVALALTSSAPAAEKLPDFVQKVQLWNCGGAEPTADGGGVMLYRVPASVRNQLTETNKNSNKTGADQMRSAAHSEIRFVVNKMKELQNVKIHLHSEHPGPTATIYWGDIYSSSQRISFGNQSKPVNITGHGLMYQLMDKYPRGRFANNVVRIIVDGPEVEFNGIEGDVRPPRPDELAPVLISYGTSISQGYNASRPDLQWNSLTARMLRHDLINLGSSGTAFCEKPMTDYIASQKWDMAVLEISVNMVGNFDTPEFKKRASYLVDTLAKTHPDAPIFCIGILPWGIGHYWGGDGARKTHEFREALKEIVENSGQTNVHYVHGPDVLSFQGLWHDMLHPSDMGMIEIATKLSDHIRNTLDN
jgi:lysophospholipase L1-like esterase